MEAQTTESLFASLDPAGREEAVRIAMRLQAHDEANAKESAGLVAGAREAGIEDRYLRAAVDRVAVPIESAPFKAGTEPGTVPTLVATLALVLFVFADGAAGAATFGGKAAADLWPAFILAGVLGATLPRRRALWLAPLLVLVVGCLVTAYYHGLASLTGYRIAEMADHYADQILRVQLVIAFLGALVANGVARLTARHP